MKAIELKDVELDKLRNQASITGEFEILKVGLKKIEKNLETIIADLIRKEYQLSNKQHISYPSIQSKLQQKIGRKITLQEKNLLHLRLRMSTYTSMKPLSHVSITIRY